MPTRDRLSRKVRSEVTTMAGRVLATAYYSQAADGIEVFPVHCPVADAHRKAAEKAHAQDVEAHWPGRPRYDWSGLRCSGLDRDGTRHHCVYWYGWAENSDSSRRVDLHTIKLRVLEKSTLQTSITCLCVGQVRNVPPGV